MQRIIAIHCASGDDDSLEIDGSGGELAIVLFGAGAVAVSSADEARLLALLLERANPCCSACQRPEAECSYRPCPAVAADRGEPWDGPASAWEARQRC